MRCPLCESPNADVQPAIRPGGGVVANRSSVSCPSCLGFLIEGRLIDGAALTPAVRATLAERARLDYREDGSAMLEVTEALVRGTSR